MTHDHQFCTFHVDRLFFAVEVDRVQEVVRHQETTRVPLAPAEISGLINLRGQIIPTIDLRRRLGLGLREPGRLAMNVLVSDGTGAVSFEVDQIEDVMTVDPESVEPAPETLPLEVRRLLQGVSKQNGRLLLLLDASLAMELAA